MTDAADATDTVASAPAGDDGTGGLPLAAQLTGALVLGAASVLAGLQWRRIRKAARVVRRDHCVAAFESHPAHSRMRVLMVGDSTGVGVGIADVQATLPALLASRLKGADIDNLCRSGARIGDVAQQLAQPLAEGRRYDLLLVFAGGNDVLRGTRVRALVAAARRLSRRAARVARRVVWLGNADVGTAPVFMPPLAWWLSWRSRRVAEVLAAETHKAGIDFVNFAAAPHGPRFASDTDRYFAPDGLHPSARANAYCLRVIMQRPALRMAAR